MQKIKLIMFIALLFTSVSYAETLKQVLQKTLNNNPQILSALANQSAAERILQQAYAETRPTIDLQVVQGEEWSNNPATRAFGFDSVTLWRSEAQVIGSQPLFTGHRITGEIAKSKFEFKSAKYRSHGVREQLALLTAIAYLNVLRTRELIQVAKNNVKIHQSTFEKVKKIYAGGAARRSDLELATARLALAKSRLVNAIAENSLANNNYRAVIGKFPAQQLQYPKKINDSLLPKTQAQAENFALANNPFLLEAINLVNAARSQVIVAKSRFYPNVNFELSGSKDDQLDGIKGSNDEFLGVFVIDYNLYRGGGDIARVREDVARVWQQKYDKDQLLLEIRQNLQDGWTDYLANTRQNKYLNTYYIYSRKTAEDYFLEFTLGQRGLFNVLDLYNETFLAKEAYINSRYDKMIAICEVLQNMGILAQTILNK